MAPLALYCGATLAAVFPGVHLPRLEDCPSQQAETAAAGVTAGPESLCPFPTRRITVPGRVTDANPSIPAGPSEPVGNASGSTSVAGVSMARNWLSGLLILVAVVLGVHALFFPGVEGYSVRRSFGGFGTGQSGWELSRPLAELLTGTVLLLAAAGILTAVVPAGPQPASATAAAGSDALRPAVVPTTTQARE